MPAPLSRTRTKICGITSINDAVTALECGADAIGLVFYDKSSRFVSPEIARAIAAQVGPFVTVVGLFVNADYAAVCNVLNTVPLHVIQFHGDESNDFCQQFNRPFIKAIRMAPEIDVESEMLRFPNASGILLDAYQAGVPGGTGTQFDWDRFPSNISVPTILAGGLSPSNVRIAIEKTKPYGVDVSGGVELSPGKKCPDKIAQFIDLASSKP